MIKVKSYDFVIIRAYKERVPEVRAASNIQICYVTLSSVEIRILKCFEIKGRFQIHRNQNFKLKNKMLDKLSL